MVRSSSDKLVVPQQALETLIQRQGYRAIVPLLFRRQPEAGGEIEHLLRLPAIAMGTNLFYAEISLRHMPAEHYAWQAARKFGGKVFEVLPAPSVTSASMRTLGAQFVSRERELELAQRQLQADEALALFEELLAHHVTPFAARVTTRAAMCEVLLSGDKPFPWFMTNGLLRAAQIVHLAWETGLGMAQTRALLESRENDVRSGGFAGLDASAFLDAVIADRFGAG
jgi:hypothetical protein